MKLHYLFWLAILSICLALISCPLLISAEDNPITTADELYSKRMNPDNISKSIDLLKKSMTGNPANYDALWRIARCYWFLGDKATKKEDKLDYFNKGQEYAKQAINTNHNQIMGHYWLATLIGCTGETRGILQSLFMVNPMKEELDLCVQIDSTFADAHNVLAQLFWKAPGPPLSIGNKKRALEESKLAVTYAPNSCEFWLYYGQIARDNKDYATAREALQKSISLPDDPEDPQGSQKYKAQAAADLQKLEGK